MTQPHRPGGELAFLTPKGGLARFAARFGPDGESAGRPGGPARTVTLDGDRTVVQYRVAPGDRRALAALEREAAAAVALERRYGEMGFREVFTRVVGYDLDAPEPFVLYRPASGEPLAAYGGALGVRDQQRVAAQLVLAVRLMSAAGLVHRAIGPDTVRWDGAHVRIAEPYAALRAGEPREAFGAAPWASPEQRGGTGTADPRDDLWSVAQLLYYLVAGRPDRGAGPPADLAAFRGLTAFHDSGVFAPSAAARPTPVALMRLLRVPDPLTAATGEAAATADRSGSSGRTAAPGRTAGPGPAAAPGRPAGPGPAAPADPLDPAHPLDPVGPGGAAYDRRIARKRADLGLDRPEPPPQEPGRQGRPPWWRLSGRRPAAPPPAPPAAPSPPAAEAASAERLCPHCLLPVAYDPSRLVTIDPKGDRIPLDVSGDLPLAHLADLLRTAYQLCPHAGGGTPHELPVPYLTNGRPLTIALVGSSGVGKTHLLAAMLAEVEQGGLEPYGLKCLPLNPDTHRAFLRDRVHSLLQGRELGRTGQQAFARFADGLLVTGNGTTRPVVFFDLAGEDLAQDGEVARFLTGVDAFVFVLDPLRALDLPSLDPVRERNGLRRRDLGDEAFTTVLNRIPRSWGPYVAAPAAVAVNKSDLVRVEPAVDRWLGRSLPPRFRPDEVRAESRDAHAFVSRHATAAWLRPFDDCARCTLHFVAATGGQARDDRFPHGVRPRRVLAPLLSIFAMCGLLPGVDHREAGI
ncbi:hypothetical protein [Streptomyces fradiae]|uniref:hypothetical protein n=1 Tax=Streptomyces fradiae TaxID=1906 RepID=UPI002943D0EB|nr:hypothetical protein [Streptomyces fradiae]WOI61822.1 hypothetical protein RYQ63_19015 [Streptomyces fradiae]